MKRRRTFFFDGLGVSGGVVIGPAYVIDSQHYQADPQTLEEEEVEPEIERFFAAVQAAKDEVMELGRTVTEKVDSQQAAIFDAHVTLLSDPLLIDQTVGTIREDHRNAEYVFWNVTQKIGKQLQELNDSYFSERSHDLYDVARRVLKFLEEEKNPEGRSIPQNSIIVAADLGPSETAEIHRDLIAGFVTDSGGPTSHAAIMAKALSLPAVVGLDFITHYVRSGDTLIVDGSTGQVILHPIPEQIEYYTRKSQEFKQLRATFSELRDLPAVTLDGTRVALQANIEFTAELDLMDSHGAEGIGLYRTEYFFIERRSLPTEAEQEEAYRKVVTAVGNHPVVFRTLDVGGDKLAGSIPTPPEHNPFLGLRAIRLCLAYPDLFRRQLRPLMRASAGRELRILLPMISSLGEIAESRRLIDEVYESLDAEGAELPTEIQVGIMVEIPSAALQIDRLAAEVDFCSIGTNDLVQYTLAVDRVNKLVRHLYREVHPAVLLLIKRVVDTCDQLGKPVSVCGEMAGHPLLSLALVGLGVRTLSMSPALMGPVKKAIRSSEKAFLEELASRLLTLGTAEEVLETLKSEVEQHEAQPSAGP